MSSINPPLRARVRTLWVFTLLIVGSVITFVIHIRGELLQKENLISSILLSLGGIAGIVTSLFLADALRQNEKHRFRSIWFRAGLVVSLFTLYAIFFLVKPPISLVDLTLLLIQSFIFSAFIYSLKSRVELDQDQITISSLTGRRTLAWKTITSVRWLDSGTIAMLGPEYPKEVILPLFTFTNKAEILNYFIHQTRIFEKDTDIENFLRGSNFKK
ncbi:MAG: hypothetical protein A3F16_08815 [Deltaproteobacteria bacterium RIFCSPHIGHO2_12_FULL_43_9]|nr:MAG: hypothetical protein A3F16_08815 [Deltaproteobacteria bacterium RIFCSPHIGHO2_12_FULL_43_9]